MAVSAARMEAVGSDVKGDQVVYSPARRLVLAEAVARAVPAAVALVVLTIVPAASQRLQHLASVVRMALSSAPAQPVGLAVVPKESAERRAPSETGSES
jgi:hypothetical protein